MTRITRLSAQDLANLALEAPDTPMHQGVLASVEAAPLRTRDGRLDIERIRAHVDSRLDRVPDLRRVIFKPGFGRGRALLVDDPAFRIENHVLTATLGTPGGEVAALEFAEREMGRPLDRSRPLWRMWLLEGWSADRIGLLVELHHAVADGPAMVNILASVFDVEALPAETRSAPWPPAPRPSSGELFADALSSRLQGLRRAAHVLAHPLRALRSGLAESRSMLTELRRRSNGPRTSLNQPTDVGRRIATLHIPFARAKQAAHSAGVKLNVVFLYVVARSLGAVLVERGETVEGVRLHTAMAVSRASVRSHTLSGNHVGSVVVYLPLGIADAREHLAAIAAATDSAKSEQQPEISVGAMVALAETGVARAFIRRQHMLNLLTTNLPGPPFPLYLAGARVSSPIALAPLAGNVTASFAALSYAGELSITVLADAHAWPDLEVLAQAMSAAWQELQPADPGVVVCRARYAAASARRATSSFERIVET